MQLVMREEPGAAWSAALAGLVHILLFAVLLFGVRWQSKLPDTVEVELWAQLPAIQPAPPVQEKPEPAPKPEPKIEPKPEPKPEPKAEAKPRKPDIAVEKEKKKAPTKQQELPRIDQRKLMTEQLAREQAALKPELDKQAEVDRQRREAAAAQSRALADYVGRIRAKIRGNIVLPPDIPGNPEAIFDLTLLPTGEVLSVRLRKSSGFKILDEAVERAISKSSPLPKPDRPDMFQRSLELKYRPLD